MTITNDDGLKNYDAYIEARTRTVAGYSVDLQNDLARLPALDAIDALEPDLTISQKAALVRKLLMGNSVTVRLFGQELAQFGVSEGFQWFAVEYFKKDPLALKFLISAVYSQFLKNCAPQLTDSQIALRDAQTSHAAQQMV